MAKGKLILKGTIELLSPALIGCGRNDRTNIDLLRDSEGKPFIPATSLMGVLKHFIKLNNHEDDLKRFWGFTEQQSAVCCSDLYCQDDKPKTVIRDGIKIDTKTGIVKFDDKTKSGAKYDYEVVERGTKFSLHMELNFSDSDRGFSRRMVATIRNVLENGKTQIGAKTNSGLGRMKLKNAHICEFEFSKKTDVLKWLKRDFSTPNPFTEQPFDIKDNIFLINAAFTLKNSFISRSYSGKPGDPDAVSIKSGNDFVIPGTSLKGAIRSRAERILNTLNKSKDILLTLFGNVDEATKEKRRGKIYIDEVLLPKFIAGLQTRIKIDRFAGGTMEGALFETMPLFNQYNKDSINLSEKVQNVKITIRDYESHEAGLMLLVLKDLWTGDLAVGGEKNVGRGVFEGFQADINWDGQNVTLQKGLTGLSDQDKEKLERFVSALRDFKEGEGDDGR